jgi:hypothetical protein
MPAPDPFDLPVNPPVSPQAFLPADAVARVEHALFWRAIGVTISKDIPTRSGKLTLDTDLPGDVKAQQVFLAAHDPARYGQVEPVRPAPAPMSVTIRVVTAQGARTGQVFEGQAMPPPGGCRDAISDGTVDSTGIATLPVLPPLSDF